MTDQLLLSAGRSNFDDCLELASECGAGIEVMAFAYPDLLDDGWKPVLQDYKRKLATLNNRSLTMHGPFIDMVSGSLDPRINQVCIDRYQHGIQICAELGARLMVVHANFIGSLHNISYRQAWHNRNIDFWGKIADYAQSHGVLIAMENMWEFDPTIIGNLLAEINHPTLKACLDIGHAHLFSDAEHTLLDWINTIKPWLIHTHLNNNNGKVDVHHSFDYHEGVLNYNEVLRLLRDLPEKPSYVLEMDSVDDMRNSLHYFTLTPPSPDLSEEKSV